MESSDSNRVYSIHVKCDCRDEDTKTELEARLKACTGTLDEVEFLSISEACAGIIIIIILIEACITI